MMYCEILSKDNDVESIMYRELLRTIYPEGSAYRSDTAGNIRNIRHITIEQLRRYHREYYRYGHWLFRLLVKATAAPQCADPTTCGSPWRGKWRQRRC